SLERITTSAGTPRASCAAIVCGPVPCDAPDPVVTLMPLDRSNSGSSFSYAPLNPPDIKTFSCADAATGQSSDVAMIKNDKALIICSSTAFPMLRDETNSTHVCRRSLDCRFYLCLAGTPSPAAIKMSPLELTAMPMVRPGAARGP